IDIALPIFVCLFILGLFLFVKDSLQIVSETNRNNFEYTVKIRASISKIDKIIENSEVSLNIISDVIQRSYDINKLYDKNYNYEYIKQNDILTRCALKNSPGINGIWFQLNADVPFSSKIYNWHILKEGKIVNLRKFFEKESNNDRKINPEEDPYYFEAIKAKKTIWSDLYTDSDIKTQMITISKPIYKKNKLIGVIGIDISVFDFEQALKNMKASFEDSEAFLLDNNNKIILSSDTKIPFKDFTFLKLNQYNSINKEYMAEYSDEGTDKTAIIIPLSNKYKVIITFPHLSVFKGFDRLFRTVYFIFGVLIVLACMAFYNRQKIIKVNKQLENETFKLKTIIDTAPTAIVVKNKEGVYIDCNNKLLEIMEVERQDFIGKTDYEIFSKETADILTEQDEIVKTTKQLKVSENWHTTKTGKSILLTKFRVPLFDINNQVIGILINAIDVTQKHNEQEQLEIAKEAAENATKMKSNFLANMSHEIRTPLNGVLGFLQLLEDTDPTEEQKEFITDAQKSSDILLNIINEILDFSKIEAGKLKIDNISFDIRSLVEDITVINIPNACQKRVDINSLICSDVPQRVFGDPGRVKQILNNLVGNAIKFTEKGEVAIYVNMESETDEEVFINFKIKDTGIGIEKEKLEMIFETFTQADESTTRKYGGTGLGLAISQKLASLMGGGINVESVLGEGSTFSVSIKFKKDKEAESEAHNLIKSIENETVLIVENKCTDLRIIKYYLNEANCFVKEVRNSNEVLSLINDENQNISAIIIDYEMEASGEISLSNIIKSNEKSKDIPLILYTSVAQKGDALSAKEKGFAGYISKPIKKQELIESIALAINNKGAQIKNELITKHLVKENKFNLKTKILMVEDTELNCKFVTKVLNNSGLNCDVAYNGQEAIEAYKTKKYDLILMDCQMPIMDGYEASEKIRELEVGTNSHIPIIALTANAMQHDREKCFRAGMDDYITKPVKTQELLSLIGKYVNVEDTYSENFEQNVFVQDNIDKMVSEIGFSQEEAAQMYKEFLEFLSQTIQELEKATEDGDFEQLGKIAHKLKGASANLRFEKISQISARLEDEKLNQSREVCIDLITQIKNESEILKS
ncbi:MAG TPA: response regulator, partial [Candidatus Gastranaerophilaceae bacterium]|nr:response regulator [Candidatus Gastranaerophilaceae bacterium]